MPVRCRVILRKDKNGSAHCTGFFKEVLLSLIPNALPGCTNPQVNQTQHSAPVAGCFAYCLFCSESRLQRSVRTVVLQTIQQQQKYQNFVNTWIDPC